jgi:hypothetical protein
MTSLEYFRFEYRMQRLTKGRIVSLYKALPFAFKTLPF